jgi:hypothetical protein
MRRERMHRQRTNRAGAVTAALAVAVAVVSATPAGAQDKPALPGVDEIVRKSNRVAYYQGANGKARATMSIFDEKGNKRTRELTILRRDWPKGEVQEAAAERDTFTGDQRFFVFFHRPPDVDKMTFLVWKHPDPKQNDDRWLYVPGLDLVRRIASTDKRTSFVGSHFFYEDVSGRSPQLDEHELLADESTGPYYVLRSTPKDIDENKTAEFDHYKTYIHKKTFMPIQTSYYDADGNEYRRYTVLEADVVAKDARGEKVSYPTAMKSRMKDMQTGGYTLLEYSNVEYNLEDLEKDVFEQRALRNPPREHLK